MTPLPSPAQLVRLAEASQHLDTCAGWLSAEWGLAQERLDAAQVASG